MPAAAKIERRNRCIQLLGYSIPRVPRPCASWWLVVSGRDPAAPVDLSFIGPGRGKLKSMNALKRFVLWDYTRTSWQYDVMVALILAFIFLTPREVFRDQPKAASIAMVRGGYWIEPQQLSGVPETEMVSRAEALVNSRFKIRTEIAVVEPIFDEEANELKGYLAFPKP